VNGTVVRSRVRRVMLLACLVFGAGPVGSALAATTAGVVPQVPLKATAVGHDTSESFETDGIHLTSLVNGNGTELGSFTQTLDYFISYDLVDFAGTSTITAADGSQLFLTFIGTEPGFAAQVFPTPFSGTLTIIGGTGRFRGAGGQGAIAGTDYGQGQFAFFLAGTLSP
jgi:hypothetical protein